MNSDFAALAADFAATSTLRVPENDPKPRMAVLASQQEHCLVELLNRWAAGELRVDIACVIRRAQSPKSQPRVSLLCSNHPRERGSYVNQILERHGVPLYYVPAGGPATDPGQLRSHESAILSLVHRTDFLVLARFMQVLSPSFLRLYGKDIVNIHHGLLCVPAQLWVPLLMRWCSGQASRVPTPRVRRFSRA